MATLNPDPNSTDGLIRSLNLLRQQGGLGRPGGLRVPGASGGSSSDDWKRNRESYLAAAGAQPENDWDKFWRPLEGVLNALTAGGSGVQNVIDKGVQFNIDQTRNAAEGRGGEAFLNYLTSPFQMLGAFGEGAKASFTSDTDNPNFMYGSKLIESLTDRGGALDPKYTDVEDNVNPVAKAAGGLAIDIFADPLTYLPGGIIAAGVRGGVRAAKGVSGLSKIPAGVKGIVKGTDNAALAYKGGKWSHRVKPVGLEQWMRVRDSDRLGKIARKEGLPLDAFYAGTVRERRAVAKQNRMTEKAFNEKLAAAKINNPQLNGLIERTTALWNGTETMRAMRGARGRMAEIGAAEYTVGARPAAAAAAADNVVGEGVEVAEEVAEEVVHEGSDAWLRPVVHFVPGMEMLPDRSYAEFVERFPKMDRGTVDRVLQAVGRYDLVGKEGLTADEYATAMREFAQTAQELRRGDEPLGIGDPRSESRGISGGTEFTRALERAARDGYGHNTPLDTEISSALSYSKGSNQQVLADLLGRLLGREATPEEISDFRYLADWVLGKGTNPDRFQNSARAREHYNKMLAAVSRLLDEAPVTEKVLFRGVAGANTDEFGLNLWKAGVGDEFELGPSSFSSNSRVAEKFGSGEGDVLLRFEGPKQALNIDALQGSMQEHLARGRFRITKVEENLTSGNYRIAKRLTIRLVDPPAKVKTAKGAKGAKASAKASAKIDDTAAEAVAAQQDEAEGLLRQETEELAAKEGITVEQAAARLDQIDLGRPMTKAQRASHKARVDALVDGYPAKNATKRVEAARKIAAGKEELDRLLNEGVVVRDILEGYDGDLPERAIEEFLEAAGALGQPYRILPTNGPGDLLRSKLTKGGTRVYNQEELRKLVDALGLDPKGKATTQKSMLDLLRTKGPQEYTRITQLEKMQTNALKEAGVLDEAEINAIADTVVPGAVIKNLADEVAAEIDAVNGGIIRDIALKSVVESLERQAPRSGTGPRTAASGVEYQRLIGEGGDYAHTRTRNQFSFLTVLKSIRAAIQELGRKNGKLNPWHEWKLERLAVKQARAYELQMGVISITMLRKKSKYAGGEGLSQAYLHLDDLYRILDEDLLLDLRVTHRINGEITFPPTEIQTAALWSMRLTHEGVDDATALKRLADFIYDEVESVSGVGLGYDVRNNPASRALADRLAVELLQPGVQARLRETHQYYGALALKLGQDKAGQMVVPLKKALNDVLSSMTSTEGDKILAIEKAVDGLRAQLKKMGMADELDGRIAKADLEAMLARILDPSGALTARFSTRTTRVQAAKPDGTPRSQSEIKARQDEVAAEHEAKHPLGGGAGRPRKPTTQAQKDRVRKQGGSSPAMNRERADQSETLHKNVVEVVEADIRKAGGKTPVETAEAAINAVEALADGGVVLKEHVAVGRMAGFLRRMSGTYGQEDLKATATRWQSLSQNLPTQYEHSIEPLVKKIGIENANSWFRSFQSAGSNEKVGEFINALPEAMRADAIEYWKHVSLYFSHETANYFARAGLDADHINSFLLMSPMAGKPHFNNYLLGPGMMGWEVGTQWRKFTEIGEEGGIDALTLLKSYNWALHNAALVPNIAADLSAQFGHARGFGMTVAQAIKLGWKRVNTDPKNGLLSKFIDPDQYFPPEIIKQLANLEVFLQYNLKLGNKGIEKWIKVSDKIVTAIKSSITLWRPGHHVVNVMGESLMNQLAGVTNPMRYPQAWMVLRAGGDFHKGSIFGANKTKPLDDMANEYGLIESADEAAEGFKNGITTSIGGTPRRWGWGTIYQLFDRGGLLINHNTAEDLVVSADEIMAAGGKFAETFAPVIKANKGLGEFSARRDNIFRIAHAVDILQKKSFRNIDEAMDYIRREIYSYHPTMQTLSGFEQRVARRVLYFYTWQRQALTRILQTLIEHPGRATVVPKANFEASTIGGDPESIGHPMPNDPRLANFAARNILGPHWYNEQGEIEGFTVNAPQLDVLQSVFGGIEVNPDKPFGNTLWEEGGEFIRNNTVGMLTPMIKAPIEMIWMTRTDGSNTIPIQDRSDYLIDQTGLGYLSRIWGRNVWNDDGIGGVRADNKGGVEQGEKSLRTFINALTGLRGTTYTDYADVAERQRTEEERRRLEDLTRNIFGNQTNPGA